MDVSVTSKETLKKKVDKILASPRFRKALLLYGIEIEQVSTPKQTDTTQRWKMESEGEGSERARSHEDRVLTSRVRRQAVLGPVAKPIADAYGSSPFSASHYGLAESIAQKVSAMAGRETRLATSSTWPCSSSATQRTSESVTALHPSKEQARAALKRRRR